MGVAGPPVVATKIINILLVMADREGRKFPTIMSNVTLVPSRRYNLFSMTKLMKDGWTLEGGINTGITLKQEGKEVHFGKKVHTTKRVLFVARITRKATKGMKLGLVSVMTRTGSGKPSNKDTPIILANGKENLVKG